jgi:thioredoxin-dependent peroxiredoxin
MFVWEMIMLSVNSKAPDFELAGSDGRKHTLKEFSGKYLVLYFYPKDDTPGCTIEAKGINSKLKQINELGAVVVGVSGDDVSSHCSFAEKYGLKFLLLSDTSKKMMEKYDAYGNKGVFGFGTFRKTYIINRSGVIVGIFPKVAPDGHEDEIITFIKKHGVKD